MRLIQKHPKYIFGWIFSFEFLAKMIGRMIYYRIAILFRYISIDLKNQSENDKNKNRVKLSKNILEASIKIEEASKLIDEAWRISEPYMKKKKSR